MTVTRYLYEDVYEDKNLFDFSDYPENLQFYDLVLKKNNWQNKGLGKKKRQLISLLDLNQRCIFWLLF